MNKMPDRIAAAGRNPLLQREARGEEEDLGRSARYKKRPGNERPGATRMAG